MKSQAVPLHCPDYQIPPWYGLTSVLHWNTLKHSGPQWIAPHSCLLSDIKTDTKGPNSFGSIHPAAERGSNDQWPRRVSVNLPLHSAVSRSTLGFSVRGGSGGRLKDQGVRSVSCGNWIHCNWSCFYFKVSFDSVASCADPSNHRRIELIQVKGPTHVSQMNTIVGPI